MLLTIPVIGLLIFLSSFFAAVEMAFVSLDRIKVREESVAGNKNALLLEKLLENPDEVVSAIVICNNLVNITAAILAGALATALFGNLGVGIATVLMTLLIVIFGEAVPKAYGIHNEQFALRAARYINIIRKLFSPIAKAFSLISGALLKILGKEERRAMIFSEDEIKTMMNLGVHDGTIEKDEQKLVEEIFEFDETKVIEVYVPLEKVVSLQENERIEDLIKKSVETGSSRFPLYRANKADIVGMVHVKDVLLKDKRLPVKAIMREILKVPARMKADDVLREMQKRKMHMALIAKEEKIIGLVTLEDLIEEVFGEIRDEHDIK